MHVLLNIESDKKGRTLKITKKRKKERTKLYNKQVNDLKREREHKKWKKRMKNFLYF